jgi:hypothetical protein
VLQRMVPAMTIKRRKHNLLFGRVIRNQHLREGSDNVYPARRESFPRSSSLWPVRLVRHQYKI